LGFWALGVPSPGAAVVGQIDNVVRLYVISGRAKMHPLLVFFALLGGVKAFGVWDCSPDLCRFPDAGGV